MHNANLDQPLHDPTRPVMDAPRSQPKKNKLLMALGLGGVLILGGGLLLVYTSKDLLFPQKEAELIPVASSPPLDSFKWESELERVSTLSGIQAKAPLLQHIAVENLILQKAAEAGLIVLPTDFFDQQQQIPEKYFKQKQSFLIEAEKNYTEREAQITGSVIGVFFYNQQMPELPFLEADTIARQLVSTARQNVVSGTWTPDEARKNLAADPIIPKLDFNYKYNTGMSFSAINVSDYSSDPEVIRAIQSLSDGTITQVSEIFRSPGNLEEYGVAYFSKKPKLNGYYFFLVLTDKKDGYYQSFDQWKSSVVQQEDLQ